MLHQHINHLIFLFQLHKELLMEIYSKLARYNPPHIIWICGRKGDNPVYLNLERTRGGGGLYGKIVWGIIILIPYQLYPTLIHLNINYTATKVVGKWKIPNHHFWKFPYQKRLENMGGNISLFWHFFVIISPLLIPLTWCYRMLQYITILINI